MPDDLRTCATMCCKFIGDESARGEQYEKALGSGASGGVVEKKIPCRKALTPAQDAIETAAGFYLGYRVRVGSPLPAGGNPPVFRRAPIIPRFYNPGALQKMEERDEKDTSADGAVSPILWASAARSDCGLSGKNARDVRRTLD